MKVDQIKAAIRKVPFRTFVIRTGSGEAYPVKHPEQCSFTPSGRTMSIWLDEYNQAIIDVSAVTEFIAAPSAGRRKEKP